MKLYRTLTDLGAPLIALYLRYRRTHGREDIARFHERLGFASQGRPEGSLVWCHAASVGESMSVLSLIEEIQKRHPSWHILLTTGTITSAQLMAQRLPETVIHQYVPVDRWKYVSRFLGHWKPDLALWVESELWPNMLGCLKSRHIPTILINGRMSEKSYRRWKLIAGGAKNMLSTFALGLAQTGTERNRFEALGMKDVRALGNLKYAAAPLPCDMEELARLKTLLNGRPSWLMASTHPGEEEIAIKTHRALGRHFPNLLTILAPRHPARGDEIEALIKKEGLTIARRSKNEDFTEESDFYLCDTLGEMGLFYRLSSVCCLAGSFTWGGHNPIEPAQLNCTIIFGPHMENFLFMADDMMAAGAVRQVQDEEELIKLLHHTIDHPEEAAELATIAAAWAEAKRGVLTETLALLDPYFAESEKSAP